MKRNKVQICILIALCMILQGCSMETIQHKSTKSELGVSTEATEKNHSSTESKTTEVNTESISKNLTSNINSTTTQKTPYSDYEIDKRANEILSGMSLSQKAAQMLLVAISAGYGEDSQKKDQYGGLVLFADSFQNSNPTLFKARMKKLQKVSKIKTIIATDEEGETVARASAYTAFRSSKFLSPRKVYQAGGFKNVKKEAREKAVFLKKLGINTNLAPVADVVYSASDFMYARSFSTNANKTSKFIRITVNQNNNKGVISTLKHFPGYGGNGDTHTNIIRDKRSLKTFENRDLKPFQAGIDTDVKMIMVGHNIVEAFDKNQPASISPKVMEYLREDMGYDGIIVTDGMDMEGIKDFVGSTNEAVIRAVLAGADMVCVTESMGSKNALIEAIKKGRIQENYINEAVLRILRAKLKIGIIK